MPIIKANELDFSKKKIRMIIAGYAGIGKTTLALSAPKPLLFDFDKGIDRVEAPYRKDTVMVQEYEHLLHDIKHENFSAYETFVIDTGGKLLDLMKPYVIKQNAQNGQRDGSLSLKGWGAVSHEFKRFTDLVNDLNKHVIYVFHTKEEQDNEMMKLRISIEGSSKNKVWEEMDLGGFVEMAGKKRTIGFSNTERYYAKGTHGIKGIYDIPTLSEDNVDNNFLTVLFEQVIKDLQTKAKEFNGAKEIYEHAMQLKIFIDSANDLEQINKILNRLKEIEHGLTSEKELKVHLLSKAKLMGYEYDKESGTFK
jgi:hypothetical protein